MTPLLYYRALASIGYERACRLVDGQSLSPSVSGVRTPARRGSTDPTATVSGENQLPPWRFSLKWNVPEGLGPPVRPRVLEGRLQEGHDEARP